VTDLVEASLVEGLTPTVEVLPSVENTVVYGSLNPKGGAHFDHSLTYTDCDQLVLTVFIGNLDSLDQGVVQSPSLEMVGQDHQEDVTADVFLAQEVGGIGDGFEEAAEVAGHAREHGIVSFPTNDPLQVLLVLDPHQQHMEVSAFVQHLTHAIDNDRQRGQLGQRIEETCTVLQNSRPQLN
jgi:hypothetical protein